MKILVNLTGVIDLRFEAEYSRFGIGKGTVILSHSGVKRLGFPSKTFNKCQLVKWRLHFINQRIPGGSPFLTGLKAMRLSGMAMELEQQANCSWIDDGRNLIITGAT